MKKTQSVTCDVWNEFKLISAFRWLLCPLISRFFSTEGSFFNHLLFHGLLILHKLVYFYWPSKPRICSNTKFFACSAYRIWHRYEENGTNYILSFCVTFPRLPATELRKVEVDLGVLLLFRRDRYNGGMWLSGCECLQFSATYGKEFGSFSSPDYPHPYQENINCLLYTFIASRDEIIEITFKDFDVQKSHLE